MQNPIGMDENWGYTPFVKPEDMGDGIVLEFPLPGWSWLPLIQSFDHGLNDWGPWLKSRPYIQISNMGGFLWIYGYVYSGKLRTVFIFSSFAIDLWFYIIKYMVKSW